MSQENVEIVRAMFAAWNARPREPDFSQVHPELVYHPRADEPDPSPHVGRDAYERLIHGFLDSFSEVTFEVLELIDADDHVIASTVLHAVLREGGSASGAGVSDTYVFVLKLRDGLVVEGWEYRTRQEALDAIGLSENVEVVRRFIEALPRAQASGDWQPVLAEVHPEVEIDDLDISLDTERYRGHDSVRKWIGDWMESWESWRLEDVQVQPVGDDRAIGLFLVHAKGKGSGIELSRRDAMVCTLRAGKIEKGTYYNDQQQALEAVGLTE
jgi:ketosteroid isomerase-like protein